MDFFFVAHPRRSREDRNLVGSPARSRGAVATRGDARGRAGMDGMHFVPFVSFERASSRASLTASTGSFQREIARALLEKLENVGFV